jgi:tetratricopeptide (TPR) repeat protein
MRKVLPIYFLLLIILHSSVQANEIDSLERLLSTAEGTEKVDVLNELFKQYVNNDPFLAMSYTKSALQIAEELDYQKGIATSYNDIGVIYRKRGKFALALENYINSFKYFSQIGDNEGLAKAYNNIGTIYSIQGDYEKALDNYLKSYEILKEIDDSKRLIGSLNNIGNVYRENGDFDRALEYYQEALELYEDEEIQNQVFEPLSSIGNIHFEREEYDEALDIYFKSLEIERTNKNLYGQAFALNNIGVVYYNKEEYKMAISFQNQALNLATRIESLPLLVNIYDGLSKSYFANDEILNAYNALQLLNAAKDSLGSREMNKRLTELETQFEFEKKESAKLLAEQEQDIVELKKESKQKSVFLTIVAALFIGFVFFSYFRMTTGLKKKSKSNSDHS